jgi:hypothetical protein
MHRWRVLLVAGALVAAVRASALDTSVTVAIPLDAEALSWTAPIKVASDPDSLDGKYVILSVARGVGNTGSTNVQLPRAGNYYVWARIKTAKGAGHVFDVELGDARYTWSIAAPTVWHWERFTHADGSGGTTPVVLSVKKPGAYPFRVLPRAGDISFDAFLITNDPYLGPIDHTQR